MEEPENLLEEVEQQFLPKPGGLVDTWRKDRAKREAEQKKKEQADERIEERSFRAVKVAQEMPEIFAIGTANVPAGGVAMVLPASPYRYRATITASAAIVLGKDGSQALGGQGYPLAANTPLVINSRAQLWAFATAAAVVNVLAEVYSPES